MEILNYYPETKLAELFDFLGFVSIYEDRERSKAYFKLMNKHRKIFKDAVVIEAGAGFGEFSQKALDMGAKKLYAVEINKYMTDLLKKRFGKNKNVRVVKKDFFDFMPAEKRADILIHDLYGPLLYDESLYALEKLKYPVENIFPNGGRLAFAVVDSKKFTDKVIDSRVLNELKGALVSDLFDPYEGKFPYEATSWTAADGLKCKNPDISQVKGDLLVFRLEIFHDGKFISSASECDNWPMVWTPRAGNRFELIFKRKGIYCNPYFKWVG